MVKVILNFSLCLAGGGDGHNHGVHVHHEVPPNRCDEPAAVYLFAEDTTKSGDFGNANTCSSNHNRHIRNPDIPPEGDQQLRLQQVKLFHPSSEPKVAEASHNHSHNHSHSHDVSQDIAFFRRGFLKIGTSCLVTFCQLIRDSCCL
jgi:hypothetical protein